MSGLRSPANLLTSANLAAGFLALILVAQGQFGWAVGCVGAAAFCDAVDGLVARLTKSGCEFGSQLDSLADLVSFGVVPALIAYLLAVHSVRVAGIAACLAFVLCAGWRLARFQVEVESRHRFVGLPVPPAGLITSVFALLSLPRGLMAVGLGVLSLLMVSRLPFPTLAEIRRWGREPTGAAQAIQK